MSNMSYCKFENTFRDLEDCSQSLHDKLSNEESRFRVRLIELCRDIVEETGGMETEESELEKLGTPADDAYEGDDDER